MDDLFLELMAEAAHDIWVEGKIKAAWRYGPITDKENLIHACLVPYSELSEADKQSDRDLVKGIPAILAKAGFKIVPQQ